MRAILLLVIVMLGVAGAEEYSLFERKPNKRLRTWFAHALQRYDIPYEIKYDYPGSTRLLVDLEHPHLPCALKGIKDWSANEGDYYIKYQIRDEGRTIRSLRVDEPWNKLLQLLSERCADSIPYSAAATAA
jgi:hypothetical protein